MIEGTLCGVAARNTEIEEDTYQIEQLQITNPEVIPHGARCEGLSGPVMDELSTITKCLSLHTVPIEGRDIQDDPIATEHALQQVLIEMKPTQGQGMPKEDVSFVLCLQPWVSVELAQQQSRGQPGHGSMPRTNMKLMLASCHSVATDGAPILLFSDPTAIPKFSPWDLCEAGNLGSMESNVMAGRALFGLQLPDGQRRCAIFLVHEKVTQGSSKSADYRAYRRIASKSLELVVVSQPVAQAFCGRLLLQHLPHATYFDPGTDWLKPIELNATFPIVLDNSPSLVTLGVAVNCWSLHKQIHRDSH